jgi:hypothetical protein
MIAPENAAGGNTALPLLKRNLAWTAAIFLVLELWRPCFFLTDDNLDSAYPFFYGVGQRLAHGQSPFYTDHLFGGGYDFLRDPSCFVWHPLYLLTSLLAVTPFHLLILEVDAFVLFMLAAAGFTLLAVRVRGEFDSGFADGWLTFFTLSFTYSMIALSTGASWLSFACTQSALPWLALGIMERRRVFSTGLITLFMLHLILGGHPAPNVSSALFLTLFAAGMCRVRGSVQPLAAWVIGCLVATVVVLPLLVPMLQGFAASARSAGVPIEDMEANNVPFKLFPTSVFFGMALWIFHRPENTHETYTVATGACAAAWCLIPALAGPRGWRRFDVVCLGLLIFLALLICRPHWISRAMLHLPVLRSLRWPFREFLQFQFFLHLFLVARRPGFAPLARWRIAALGTVVMVVPMVLYFVPPTFNTMNWDRRLILSGAMDRYWAQARTYLRPGDKIAVLIPLKLYSNNRFEEPYSLLGTYDYAILAGIVNASGYSQTAPQDQLYTPGISFYPFGAYIPEYRPALLRERPDLKFITLESLAPLKITLSSATGPTIDLTPLVPRALSPPPSEYAQPAQSEP